MIHATRQALVTPTDLDRPTKWSFRLVASLLFVVTSVATLTFCEQMAAMGEMAMPGGWTMSMMWMRMPGQSWPGFAGAFISMWTLMMMAMMAPVLVPALARYRRANAISHGAHVELETLAIVTGYFSVWTLVGLAMFAFGIAVATLAMHVGALAIRVPTVAGVVMLLAGLSQFSPWKVERLHCCYAVLGKRLPRNTRAAWVEGLRFGIHCVICCAPLVAMLAVLGIMDVRVMAAITIATALERTQRFGTQVAQLSGTVAIAVGASLLIQAAM